MRWVLLLIIGFHTDPKTGWPVENGQKVMGHYRTLDHCRHAQEIEIKYHQGPVHHNGWVYICVPSSTVE